MPTRNVNLTDELDRLVLARIESGRYENASEVVRTALRSLESEEQEYETKVAALRTAIDEGHPFTRVRATLKLSKKRTAVTAFRLSRRTEADLIEIGRYTLSNWGEDQTVGYIDDLERVASNSPIILISAGPVTISAPAWSYGVRSACCVSPAICRRHPGFAYP